MDRKTFARALKRAHDEHLSIQASHLGEAGAQMWEVVHPEEADGFYAVRWDPEAHTYSCPCEAGRRLIPCKHLVLVLASLMPAYAAEQMGLGFGTDDTKGSESTMAQDTKSKYSVPVVRNQPFSLFKTTGEDTMATTAKTSKATGAAAKAARQAKLTVVQQQAPEAPEATIVAAAAVTEVAAQAATQAEQPTAPTAKAPKAPPVKTQKTLDDVISKQAAKQSTYPPLVVAGYTVERMRAGQDRAEAVEDCLAAIRSIILSAFADMHEGEDYRAAVLRIMTRPDVRDKPAADPDAAATAPTGTVA